MKMKQSTSTIQSQLHDFFSQQSVRSQQRYDSEDDRKELSRFFHWTSQFATEYITSRTSRASDLATDNIQKAQILAREFIGSGNHDFFATCVDGRNMPTVMFSKPPHVGGVLRAPAGAVTGFMEGQQAGTVFIDKTSYVVQHIMRLLEERPGETIFYGLDSHVGCAARGLIHSTEGGKQSDQGLRSDVKSKLMTALGLRQLQEWMQDEGKVVAEIIPTFFSYDPHHGGVIMGLEMYVNDPRVVEHGYTEEILDTLSQEGKIVRSIDLFGDPEILSELKMVITASSADFRQKFDKSLLANWQAVTKLYKKGEGKTFKKIHKLLLNAYDLGGWKVGKGDNFPTREISQRTVKQKAKFLLKNLLTRYSIAGTAHKWPYDSHEEEMVVITDGGYAPFSHVNAFAVFSRDLNALLPNTKLTIDLIRNFRKTGNSKDPVPELNLSQEEFCSAPVLIVNKAVFRHIDEQDWQVLSQLQLLKVLRAIDWNDPDVLNWGKTEIEKMLARAAEGEKLSVELSVALDFAEVVFELFERLRLMMRDKYFRHMILYGNIVLLNLIVDADRRPRVVVPFVV